jgi:hypothetical protein
MQQQLDGWSCGFFVFMAIQAFVKHQGFDSVGNDGLVEIRHMALQLLLGIPP